MNMAQPITNSQIKEAVDNIVPVINVKLDIINERLARINGTVVELQRGAANKETRITVLERASAREAEDVEALEACVQDIKLNQAKSAGIGAIVGALIVALPQLIQALR